ncbi:OmpA family protein [Methylobacterium sp. 190mf]|nr:OmpA family protein [Methylobacterium sp. 190mf]
MRTVALALLGSVLTGSVCLAQEPASPVPTTEEIVRALNPTTAVQTRSLRGIQVIPGKEVAPPSIDLTINFHYDSAKLGGEEMLVLKRLGTALQDPRLAGYSFLIAGHTDAKGSEQYNQRLSEARAKTARDHLIFFYDIDPRRLQAVGYGKSKLIAPDQPESAANRRVQIVNLGPTG